MKSHRIKESEKGFTRFQERLLESATEQPDGDQKGNEREFIKAVTQQMLENAKRSNQSSSQ